MIRGTNPPAEEAPAVPTLEEMAVAIQQQRELLDEARARVEELRGPYEAAVDTRRDAKRRLDEMERSMAAAKRAHAIRRALGEQGIEYDGDVVIAVARQYTEGAKLFLLVAVGREGTGLYLSTPGRSHRYQGKEHAVRLAQAVAHGFDPDAPVPQHYDRTYEDERRAGLVIWQARGRGDFGFSGAYRPLPPPEGGKWRWLVVRDQEELHAG